MLGGVPDVPAVPDVQTNRYAPFESSPVILPRDAGEERGGGWNCWNVWNDWNPGYLQETARHGVRRRSTY